MEKVALQTHAITEDEWIDAWQRLRLHTWKRYGWLHKRLGLNLDDLVHQAIVDTMEGTRTWPPIDRNTGEIRQDVTLLSFLCGVVRNNAYHLWVKEKKRISFERSDNDEPAMPKSLEILLAESNGSYPHLTRPEDVERQTIYNQITEKMSELVGDDEVARNILTEWRKDPTLKPSDIATVLGLNITHIQNAQKRLRRKLEELRGN